MENLPFGDLLKAFRKRQKLNQSELARRMGKHLNTIGTWERGECLPNGKSMILEIARILHLSDQETRQLLEASLTASTPYWHVPHQRNHFFTGREDILKTLHTRLSPERARTLTRSSALYGIGGIGKTQLAVEYAYQHALEYQAIFWIEAESVETITSSFLQIARQLNSSEKQGMDLQHAVDSVHRWLMFHSHWLLIWDNVEDLALFQRFQPLTRQGSVLITTRRQTLGTTAHTFEVPPMPFNEGRLLLLRRARALPRLVIGENIKQHPTITPGEYAAAQKLTMIMGGLPLALDQIGAYANETGCSLADYLQRYQKQQMLMLNRRGTSGSHPHSVTTTFMLAIQQIKQAYPEAVDLLRLCAFLHPDAIPEEIFTEGAVYLGERLASLVKDVLSLDEALATLGTCSLLQRRPVEKMFTIHRLLQAVLQETLEETERRAWAEQAMLVVNEAFPHAEHSTWLQCERLLPQALTALRVIKQYQIENKAAGRLLSKTTFYLQNRARYTETQPLFRVTIQ